MALSTQKRSVLAAATAVLCTLCVLVYRGVRVHAEGVPSTPLFYYHGRLVESGMPVNQPRDFSLTVHDAAQPSGNPDTTRVCGPFTAQDVAVTDGHFTLEIPDDCRAAVEQEPDLWVALTVEGEAMTGRAKLAAVPYAVSAAQAQVATHAVDGVPPGTIVAFGGTTVPPGWLLCDGQGYSSAAYPALHAAIETSWGDGREDCAAAPCDFNVPDLRGRFLRGVDSNAARDPDLAARTASRAGGHAAGLVGSVQGDSIKSHRHVYATYQCIPAGGGSTCAPAYNGSGNPWTDPSSGPEQETRPKNAYVNYIIKL